MSHLTKSLNSCDNITTGSCRSFTNFIMLNKNQNYITSNDLLPQRNWKKNQSFNSIDLNPSYIDQFKSNSNDDRLIEHLRSSNLLKRKSYLLASHLLSNNLFTDEDYITDFNKTEFDNDDDIFESAMNNKVYKKQYSLIPLNNNYRKKKPNKLNSFKKNLIRSCSCTDLSDSLMSQTSCSSSNDFYYEKKQSTYLECMDFDKPKVIYSMYSTPPFEAKKQSSVHLKNSKDEIFEKSKSITKLKELNGKLKNMFFIFLTIGC